MEPISQKLLRLVFLGLYKFLSFLKVYEFSSSSEMARFFFDSDFRKHKKHPTRKIHWKAFSPQKREISLSVYNISNLDFHKIIHIGNKFVGKYKGESVAGFAHGSLAQIEQLMLSNSGPKVTAEFWPLPHYRHINLNPQVDEAFSQLRSQLLAQNLNKTLLDQKKYSSEYF